MYIKAILRSFATATLLATLWPSAHLTAATAATAEETYLATCAICHGADGAGQTARGKKFKLKDVRSAEVQKLSDTQLTEIIAKGKGKDMPGYEKELGKDGVAGQVAHIRALAKKK